MATTAPTQAPTPSGHKLSLYLYGTIDDVQDEVGYIVTAGVVLGVLVGLYWTLSHALGALFFSLSKKDRSGYWFEAGVAQTVVQAAGLAIGTWWFAIFWDMRHHQTTGGPVGADSWFAAGLTKNGSLVYNQLQPQDDMVCYAGIFALFGAWSFWLSHVIFLTGVKLDSQVAVEFTHYMNFSTGHMVIAAMVLVQAVIYYTKAEAGSAGLSYDSTWHNWVLVNGITIAAALTMRTAFFWNDMQRYWRDVDSDANFVEDYVEKKGMGTWVYNPYGGVKYDGVKTLSDEWGDSKSVKAMLKKNREEIGPAVKHVSAYDGFSVPGIFPSVPLPTFGKVAIAFFHLQIGLSIYSTMEQAVAYFLLFGVLPLLIDDIARDRKRFTANYIIGYFFGILIANWQAYTPCSHPEDLADDCYNYDLEGRKTRNLFLWNPTPVDYSPTDYAVSQRFVGATTSYFLFWFIWPLLTAFLSFAWAWRVEGDIVNEFSPTKPTAAFRRVKARANARKVAPGGG